MKLRALWVGRTRNRQFAELSRDYIGRIQHFLPFEAVELREPKTEAARRIASEGERLLAALEASDRIIALDPEGQTWSSEQLARLVQEHMTADPRRLTFVIGGFGGLSETVKDRADLLWSLSRLTFPHDLARVIVLEQLYRALSIVHNLPYSK